MKKVTKKTVASKYREGGGWIVSSYRPANDTWVLSSPQPYRVACAMVRAAREDWDTDAQQYATSYGWSTKAY